MTILTLGIGIILIISSMVSMFGFFSKNEWRAPLLELSAHLEGSFSKAEQRRVRRRAVFIPIFNLGLFNIGGIVILTLPILRNYRNIVSIALIVILFWLLRGAYRIIRVFYSRKVRLLNYLFSLYLFAWRRDFLSKYSDQEIENAICSVCDIDGCALISKNMSLKDFLIVLHQKTRPPLEHDVYPKILGENIARAEKKILR